MGLMVACVVLAGCSTAKVAEVPKEERHEQLPPEQIKALRSTLSRHGSSGLYVAPYIVPNVLETARQSCATPADEQVLAVLDATLLGSAKNCFLVGSSGVYFRNDWSAKTPGRTYVPYAEFQNASISRNDALDVSIGGPVFSVSNCSMSKDAVFRLISDLQSCLKKSATDKIADTKPLSETPKSVSGATLLPSSPVATGPGSGLALIVGINKYDLMGGLNNCRQDAVELSNLLIQRAGYTPGRVILQTDDARNAEGLATYTALTRRIGQVCKLAKPEDVLLVYFAGHGITVNGEGYLVPQDGGDAQTSISVRWLQSQMEASKAKSKVLILDACHSGTAVRGVEGISPSLVGRDGIVTITSCADSEMSYSNGDHGVFTESLLSGLKGTADKNKDGKITNLELFSHIQDSMEDWCLKTSKTQRPQMFPLKGVEVPLTTSGVLNTP